MKLQYLRIRFRDQKAKDADLLVQNQAWRVIKDHKRIHTRNMARQLSLIISGPTFRAIK
jgi:hypothetical protein